MTIAVSATAAETTSDANTVGNLPTNQLVVYVSAAGTGGLVPDLTPAQSRATQTRVDDIAASIGTHDVVTLDGAVNLTQPDLAGPGNSRGGRDTASLVKVTTHGRGFSESRVATLYVATPAVLAHFGIRPAQVDPTADIITSRTDLGGLLLAYGSRETTRPKIQTVNLPHYTSDPNTLITAHAIQVLGLQVLRAGWMIQAAKPLTTAQIDAARRLAAAAGLTIETRSTQRSLTRLGHEATAAGMLLALGVLAMTVGLIRSETANDLRTLAATGASSTTRRTLTGATAGALALLGALLGTAGAYVALIAWHRSNLHALSHVPVVNLVVIMAGLPLAATTAGWLLAGHEPPVMARQPLA